MSKQVCLLIKAIRGNHPWILDSRCMYSYQLRQQMIQRGNCFTTTCQRQTSRCNQSTSCSHLVTRVAVYYSEKAKLQQKIQSSFFSLKLSLTGTVTESQVLLMLVTICRIQANSNQLITCWQTKNEEILRTRIMITDSISNIFRSPFTHKTVVIKDY